MAKSNPDFKLASNPSLQLSEFRRLAGLNHAHLSKLLVLNPNCPAEIIDQVIHNNGSYHTLGFAFRHPNLSEETLNKFLNSKDISKKAFAFGNAKVSLQLIKDHLKLSDDPKIIIGVLHNPNTDEETLSFIFNKYSEIPSVVLHLAGNGKTPPGLLQNIYRRLSFDDGGYTQKVKKSLILNPSTPSDVYQKLSEDKSPCVLSAFIFKDNDMKVPNDNTESSLLMSFLNTEEISLIEKAIRHPKIEESVLFKYLDYPAPIPQAIAKNPNAGREILLSLHKKGVKGAIEHKNFPPEIKEIKRLLLIKAPPSSFKQK
jgi:hypothetical protein